MNLISNLNPFHYFSNNPEGSGLVNNIKPKLQKIMNVASTVFACIRGSDGCTQNEATEFTNPSNNFHQISRECINGYPAGGSCFDSAISTLPERCNATFKSSLETIDYIDISSCYFDDVIFSQDSSIPADQNFIDCVNKILSEANQCAVDEVKNDQYKVIGYGIAAFTIFCILGCSIMALKNYIQKKRYEAESKPKDDTSIELQTVTTDKDVSDNGK